MAVVRDLDKTFPATVTNPDAIPSTTSSRPVRQGHGGRRLPGVVGTGRPGPGCALPRCRPPTWPRRASEAAVTAHPDHLCPSDDTHTPAAAVRVRSTIRQECTRTLPLPRATPGFRAARASVAI